MKTEELDASIITVDILLAVKRQDEDYMLLSRLYQKLKEDHGLRLASVEMNESGRICRTVFEEG
jgi:hypothetical protein